MDDAGKSRRRRLCCSKGGLPKPVSAGPSLGRRERALMETMAPDTSVINTSEPRKPAGAEHRPAHWGGVFAMSLCVFALIASEFMPVSLLTPMAAELQVSEGMVGQGIAISGLFAVLTSLSVSTLAGSTNRKTLLLGLTALMAVSGALVALAPGYLL